jgi:hypothetical protein
MYKGFLVDAALLEKDIHLALGCTACHKGDNSVVSKEDAHKGLVKRPSDDLSLCGQCHGEIGAAYGKSIHYTTAGQRHGVAGRFSPAEQKRFDEKVFSQSCRSCHASCGDCHVKGPDVSGISVGLLAGHKFIRRDEGRTCGACHGGRVYPEFTGEYGGRPDIHYQRGMLCMDCHTKAELHGDGTAYKSKAEVKGKPDCRKCHPPSTERRLGLRIAHAGHRDKVSCYGCHTSAPYRQCMSCHAGQGSASRPGLLLGRSPRDGRLTTLRLVPTVRDTFAGAGIAMEKFDALPNYWDSPVHSIRKKTSRTRSCDACHREKQDFLTKDALVPGGSRANERLIYLPKPINR